MKMKTTTTTVCAAHYFQVVDHRKKLEMHSSIHQFVIHQMPQAAKTGAYRKKINPPRVYTITNAPNAVYTTCCRRERKKSAANAGRYSIWKGEVEIGSALILLPFCLYRHKSTVPTSNINTEWCSSAANHCQPAIWPNYLRGGGRCGGVPFKAQERTC